MTRSYVLDDTIPDASADAGREDRLHVCASHLEQVLPSAAAHT